MQIRSAVVCGVLAVGLGGTWGSALITGAANDRSAGASRGAPVAGEPAGPAREIQKAGALAVADPPAADQRGADDRGVDQRAVCEPAGSAPEYSPEVVERLLAEARAGGSARRGALLFGSSHLACLSCHRVGETGGQAGPQLDDLARRRKPGEIVESLLWPAREVPREYQAWVVETTDGKVHKGYRHAESDTELVLRDPALGTLTKLPRNEIEEQQSVGTLMPAGLTVNLSVTQRRDLVRFLLELGHDPALPGLVRPQTHAPPAWEYAKGPLSPTRWPFAGEFVNRDRLYDFYTKEARHFAALDLIPSLLPAYPGIDGGSFGHWGNQNEQTWASDRWNDTDLGTLHAAVFRGAGKTVPKGVCVRLGEQRELAVCFDPQTLEYPVAWQGGFVKFSSVRHGFMDGAVLVGQPLPAPQTAPRAGRQRYLGYYRHGTRVLFVYERDGVRYLDAPTVRDGQFERVVAPFERHPLRDLTAGGPAQWPQEFVLPGQPGKEDAAWVVDRLPAPFDNPWRVPLFFSGHDFLPDGTAFACTMQGDVWRITGLDAGLQQVTWKRFASGLNQPLGLKVVGGRVHVLGRDQLTRLHDLNDDGEADFHECVSHAYVTSPAGHDFICGLESDGRGNFYTASGNQGLLRVSDNGVDVEVLASGFRNPDGLGLLADGALTVPCSEGEWTPATQICLVRPTPRGSEFPAPHFGYPGPRRGERPTFPLVYLPRGLDNSAGGQVAVDSDRWGPVQGVAVHLSFGTASQFLLLRDEVRGQPQGAIVPLPGEFSSGAHRGRFAPHDGQLYVTGMAGWGAYNSQVGCFERVRYTGQPVCLPRGFHVHQNGVLVEYTQPVQPEVAGEATRQFAQAWNYRYGAGYGSEEFSPSHRGTIGHDHWPITQAVVLPGARRVFYEIPDLQPVGQLHLALQVDAGPAVELFATVHALAEPFTDWKGYSPVDKVIAAHPLLVDLANQAQAKPNPWKGPVPESREVVLEAGKNLAYVQRTLRAQAGERLKLVFRNPDVVPHNVVVLKPGALERVGQLANRLIAAPDAVVRQYVPESSDVLYYSDIVPPGGEFAIFVTAPAEPGEYPYLCSFPGHWMVMNGVLQVEPAR